MNSSSQAARLAWLQPQRTHIARAFASVRPRTWLICLAIFVLVVTVVVLLARAFPLASTIAFSLAFVALHLAVIAQAVKLAVLASRVQGPRPPRSASLIVALHWAMSATFAIFIPLERTPLLSTLDHALPLSTFWWLPLLITTAAILCINTLFRLTR